MAFFVQDLLIFQTSLSKEKKKYMRSWITALSKREAIKQWYRCYCHRALELGRDHQNVVTRESGNLILEISYPGCLRVLMQSK